MALTQTYVNPAIAGNSGTGTIGDPYGDLQYALDTMVRDAVNGDQINIKAGTAEVLVASLTLAIYGTPDFVAPLMLRGYTSAADDGGVAEIDCGGATMFASAYGYIILADLEAHTFGNNSGVVLDDYCTMYRCEVHKGASAPSSKGAVVLDDYCQVVGCYVHDYDVTGISLGHGCLIDSCFISDMVYASPPGWGIVLGSGTTAVKSCILYNARITHSNSTGFGFILGNVIYSPIASTEDGILLGSATGGFARCDAVVMNNIICGFSGVGGSGIASASADITRIMGANAFWNNTDNYVLTNAPNVDLRSGDVALGADPFTNAAGGDFSLTTVAQAALRSAGWPASYLGASTDPHITIGVVQYGDAPPVTGGRKYVFW